METIKSGEVGFISPFKQTFPTDCIVVRDSVFRVPNYATAYCYVIAGSARVENKQFEEGEYFLCPSLESIHCNTGQVAIFVRHGFQAQRTFGGFIEGHGRALEGVQGVQVTKLVARHTPNDPGFMSVHLPRSIKTEMRRRPVPSFNIIVEGNLRVDCSGSSQTISPGDVFVLDKFEPHRFHTGDTPVVYVSFEAVEV